MRVTRTTGPDEDLATLAEAKSHLRVDHDEEDGIINTYINSAREWAEGYMRRSLIEQTWTAILDYFPVADGPIALPNGPVLSVTSISYYDSENAQQTLSASEYQLVKCDGYALLYPGVDQSWPGYYERQDAVTIVYTAGYGTSREDVPEEIRTAVLYRVGDLYEQRAQSDHLRTSRAYETDFCNGLLDHFRVFVA